MRNLRLEIRLSEDEQRSIAQAADRVGKAIGTYVREKALGEEIRQPVRSRSKVLEKIVERKPAPAVKAQPDEAPSRKRSAPNFRQI